MTKRKSKKAKTAKKTRKRRSAKVRREADPLAASQPSEDRTATTGEAASGGGPATGGPAAPPPIDAATADKIVLLMIAGLRHQAVIDACTEELGLTPGQVPQALVEARRKITRAADYDRDEVLGEAITRLDDLYQRAISADEVSVALAAQREKDRLLGIGPTAPGTEEKATGETGPTPEERRRIENAELAEIVMQIVNDIEPLELTQDIDATDADLVTMAGQEIKRLRKALKRATTKKRKPKAKAKTKAKPKPRAAPPAPAANGKPT